MHRLRFPALCLVLIALVGACGPAEDAGDVDDAALSAAADLRVRIERLVLEHAYLTAFITENAATGRTKEFQGAASAFDDNGVDLAREIDTQYGEASQRAFLAMWRKYEPLLGAYAARLAQRDPTAAIAKRLDQFPAQLGALMSTITPLLNPHRATQQMKDVMSAVKSFIALQAKKDFAKADSTVRTAGARAGLLGAEIATAMIEDHPAILRGDPNAPGALFRYKLSGSLAENVYLLALATENSATKRSAEQKAATSALKASTDQLVSHLKGFYGAGFEKSFRPQWERHSDLLLAYAAAGKDKAKKDKAAADLKQLSKDLATFVNGANKELDANELEHLFTGLAAAQMAVVDQQVAGDFSKAGVAIRAAAQATEGIAATLAQGTVLRFPERFRLPGRSGRTPAG